MEARLFFQKNKQYIMYAVAGILSTLVNWIAYACCMNILSDEMADYQITISNSFAWVITLAFSYVFYKNWVFESKTNSRHDLIREMLSFTGARLITGVIEVFGLPLLVSLGMDSTVLGVRGLAAKIWITLIVTVLNYFLSKRFVFRTEPAPAYKAGQLL